MRALVLVLVLVGCGSQSMASDPAPDGNADRTPDGSAPLVACDANAVYTPVAFKGVTPTGPLDTTLQAFAWHFGKSGGTCGESYVVDLAQKTTEPDCSRIIELGIRAPFGTGTLSGWALVDGTHENDDVKFIGTADLGTVASPRITGRFVSSAPGWSLDIAVDLVSQRSEDCAF